MTENCIKLTSKKHWTYFSKVCKSYDLSILIVFHTISQSLLDLQVSQILDRFSDTCQDKIPSVKEKISYCTCTRNFLPPRLRVICLGKCRKSYINYQYQEFETLLCQVRIEKVVKNNQTRKMIEFTDFGGF